MKGKPMKPSLRRLLAIIGIAGVIGTVGYLYWDMFAAVAERRTSVAGQGRAVRDASWLAKGAAVYVRDCASCHGAKLEGQANWRERLPNGRMPAPPHDDSGHTWHHPDDVLFGIVKCGLVPGKYAPEGYRSDMPAFGGVLSDDEIGAVLAYLETHWSPKVREFRAQLRRQAGNSTRAGSCR